MDKLEDMGREEFLEFLQSFKKTISEIDCEDEKVKSRDASLDLKDPRYQSRLRA